MTEIAHGHTGIDIHPAPPSTNHFSSITAQAL